MQRISNLAMQFNFLDRFCWNKFWLLYVQFQIELKSIVKAYFSLDLFANYSLM